MISPDPYCSKQAKKKMLEPEWHTEIVKRLEAYEQGRSVTYSRMETRTILKEHLDALKN